MRLFYCCVFTFSRVHTQNDICNTRIRSNPLEFYSFYLIATEIQTYSSSSSGRFENALGGSCGILLLYRDLQKISHFNVIQENNNLYAANLYFFEALIFNREDDVILISKRRSISGEHSLSSVVNAVR